ncbi:unnamed protein product [Nyctereutes procyonoides]|uniref:(raccoon dog) hypothetical protein n=1 Tax=Nyctereutes procyonoides TaxID=34880 RepID=A0A811YIN6_NYCPR|nr:unnamed protein product [Nyctereutes procyonoides]
MVESAERQKADSSETGENLVNLACVGSGTMNGLGFPGPGPDISVPRPQSTGLFGRCHEDLAGHFSFYLLFQILVDGPKSWNGIPAGRRARERWGGVNLLTNPDLQLKILSDLGAHTKLVEQELRAKSIDRKLWQSNHSKRLFRDLVSLQVLEEQVLNAALREKLEPPGPGPDMTILCDPETLFYESPHLTLDSLPPLWLQLRPPLQRILSSCTGH